MAAEISWQLVEGLPVLSVGGSCETKINEGRAC